MAQEELADESTHVTSNNINKISKDSKVRRIRYMGSWCYIWPQGEVTRLPLPIILHLPMNMFLYAALNN